mgnify:FL=1
MKGSNTHNRRTVFTVIYLAMRYYAAYMLLSYGFAKVMGAQFTVLDSQLAKPMGEVSGFWLTWYYFGYSPLYSAVIAGAQIVGACLLCFRRTALLGVLLLLPVIVNIVGIDLWVIRFPAGSGALRNAFLVLGALLIVLAFHAADLYRFFMRKRDDLALLARLRPWILGFQIIIVAGMLGYTAHEAYWEANVNNRAPSPIDGAWRLVKAQPESAKLPSWIYFEYNRAHMVVFRFPNGKSEMHDFRADPRTKTLNISREWLSPGSDVFEGSWERDGDTLRVHGTWGNAAPVDMIFERKHMPVKDHE